MILISNPNKNQMNFRSNDDWKSNGKSIILSIIGISNHVFFGPYFKSMEKSKFIARNFVDTIRLVFIFLFFFCETKQVALSQNMIKQHHMITKMLCSSNFSTS